MVRRDAAFLKAERIATIQKTIMHDIAKGIDIERLLREIEYSIGLNRDTALRYVQLVVDRQGWLISEGKIIATFEEEVSQDEEKR